MRRRTERWALATILSAAAALRLAHWLAVRDLPFFSQLAMDAQEYDRWASAIAGGEWLGTGVFFQAPLYPYLLAIVYALAGHHYDAVYLAQIAGSLVTIWALWRAGRELSGAPGAALASAAIAALYGPFVFADVQVGKESLAVAATCLLLWALAVAWRRNGYASWFAAGLLLGVLALLRENALLLLPLLAALPWLGGERRARAWAASALVVAGLACALAPVAARNALVGGEALPTTFQGGVNFWIGNNPEADGTYRPLSAGKQIPALERAEAVRLAEQAEGRSLTAAEVSSYWLGRALGWARAHPVDFAALQLRKLRLFWGWYEWPDALDYYWVRERSPALGLPLVEFGTLTLWALAGLWIARRRLLRDYAPPLVFALGWTAAAVAFFVFARYRLPVAPALAIFAGVALDRLVAELRTPRERGRAVVLAAAAAVAWVAPHLAGFAPRGDLVEYNLGRLAEERGDVAAAESHYRATLEIDPHAFLALQNLGNLAARRRDYPAALGYYERAAAIEPDSDDVESNLGAVHLALGRLGPARRHLERALELNPRSGSARHNLGILLERVAAEGAEAEAGPAQGRAEDE